MDHDETLNQPKLMRYSDSKSVAVPIPSIAPGNITTGSSPVCGVYPRSLRGTLYIVLVKLITSYPIHNPVVKQATMYCPPLLTEKPLTLTAVSLETTTFIN